MRKTSHDGLDSTSITSGLENEIKKASTSILKSKKNSIKRKVPNFSHESDDGIIEPLLQTDKDKSDVANRSAKYLLAKSKTDSISEVDDLNIVSENIAILSAPTPISTTNKVLNNIKDFPTCITNVHITTSNQNLKPSMCSGGDIIKETNTSKSPILVEFERSKSITLSTSPLIFTTAKIHTDSKSKPMEPIQITPVPILSTIEKIDKSAVTSDFSVENIVKNRDMQENNLQNLTKMSKESPSDVVLSFKDSSNISESGSRNLAQISSSTNKTAGKKSDLNHFIKLDNSKTKVMKHSSNEKFETENTSVTLISSGDILKPSGSFKASGKETPQSLKGMNIKQEDFEERKEVDLKTNVKDLHEGLELQGQRTDKNNTTLSKNNSKKLQRQKKATLEDVGIHDSVSKNKSEINDYKVNINTGITFITKESTSILSSPASNSTISSNQYYAAGHSVTTPLSSNKTMFQVTTQHSSYSATNVSPIVSKTSSKITNESEAPNMLQKDLSQVKDEKPEKKSAVTLPSYIVPTSKTKIGAPLSSTSNVSKPDSVVLVTKTTNTIKSPESITKNTGGDVLHETVPKTISTMTSYKTKPKTPSTVTPREAVTKVSNTVTTEAAKPKTTTSSVESTKSSNKVTPHELVSKISSPVISGEVMTTTISTVRPREAITSKNTPHKALLKTTSTTIPNEIVSNTDSTPTARESVKKTSNAVAPEEAIIKTISTRTPPETITKTTMATSPRETVTKTNSTKTPSQVVTKTLGSVTPRETVSATSDDATLREVVTKSTEIPRVAAPKTGDTPISREAVTKATSIAVPSKTAPKTTSGVTSNMISITTSTVTPREGVMKSMSTSTPLETIAKTTSSEAPREEVIKSPSTSAGNKTIKGMSSSKYIKQSSNSQQSKSKTDTLNKDGRA